MKSKGFSSEKICCVLSPSTKLFEKIMLLVAACINILRSFLGANAAPKSFSSEKLRCESSHSLDFWLNHALIYNAHLFTKNILCGWKSNLMNEVQGFLFEKMCCDLSRGTKVLTESCPDLPRASASWSSFLGAKSAIWWNQKAFHLKKYAVIFRQVQNFLRKSCS